MSFQVYPIQEFLVSPALPPALSRLSELANNLLWSWDQTIRSLFRRMDQELWRKCGHNPVLMLNRIPRASLEKLAANSLFITFYRRACERYDSYMQGVRPETGRDAMSIAYFSMEYGLSESLTIYSGGLGILSGDHLKAASDAGLPLVGVGLLYQRGYLQQHLTPDGWQVERNPENDFYTWPVQPVYGAAGAELRVQVEMPSGLVHVKVWRMNVGRVRLFLLDTNIPENTSPYNRDITDLLYGGDDRDRLRQEVLLGVGGLRALRALGIEPTVFHMNEGHSAFLAIERVRTLMATAGLSFEEALEAARASNCFTTHTAVPAGLDRFDRALIEEYFGRYCEAAAIPFQRFLELGSANPYDQQSKFSMAVLAMTASTRRNAVSLLHGKVSQELFQDLWPGLPIPEVPVIGVTNGVHLPSWLNGDLAQIYDQYLQPDWRDRYHERGVWEGIADIPNGELWEAQRRRKRRLVTFVRERLTQRAQARRASSAELRRIAELLNPDAFTIGFARRFATYKRATLLFRDPERLRRMLTNPAMPVQILIAGKAHPKDNPGKQYIKEIVQLTRDPQFGKHIVFIEDYDIQVGRELYHGVDLWLNNPRRGEEACGTSGMKAGINGKLNLSVLDGWFDEAGDGYGSWPIGDRDPYDPGQDELHANLMYSLLETEILPMYYQGREEGVPTAWMQRVKHCLANVSPEFNCRRMIADYRSRLYEPAHEAGLRTREGNYEPVRQKVRWQKAVDESWPAVRLLNTPAEGRFVLSGSPVRLSALADLAGLEPGDVQVQAVVGHIGTSGAIEDSSLLTLVHEGAEGGLERFGCEFTPLLTGRLGFALRITPNHSEDPITRPCFARVKWAGQ